VDDEACVCKALERLLKSAGFDVVTFTGGAPFLKFVETGRVDCAIVDLHMPHLSGLDVQLKLGNAGKRVPVVVVTGQDTPESYRSVMDAGAVAYLRKPADDQALVEAVEKGISRNNS
jgi:FixJ family two-component response regulator